PGVLLSMLLVMLYAFSFSWIFACLGLTVRKTESLTTMSYLVLYPLMFTSNVFADTSTMPDWLGPVVAYNPVSLASSSARALMHGTADTAALTATLISLGCIIAVFMPLAFQLYRKKSK
ncbi:ABC transporter permease, partial [Paenibacillus favisporus]